MTTIDENKTRTEEMTMNAKQERARIDALVGMTEFTVKVMWGVVVERGRGLNFKVHGKHAAYQGVMEAVRAIPAEAR